jgi:uncharacterized membrane protein YeaQ/YmgE (transglycosylase-associated protein family)
LRQSEAEMITVLEWIFFGLVVGLVGKLVMPGKDPGGIIGTTAIGMVGAVIGGYLGRQMGLYDETDPVGFIMAVIGAVVFLAFYRWLAT